MPRSGTEHIVSVYFSSLHGMDLYMLMSPSLSVTSKYRGHDHII